jgi:hypothetical protein
MTEECLLCRQQAADWEFDSDLGAALVPVGAGYVSIDFAKIRDVFVGDIPRRQPQAMAVAQKPIAGVVFEQSVPEAAWNSVSSWNMVAQQDRSLNPQLERFYARRFNAQTTEINSSDLPSISDPQEVAKLITEAASS